MSFRMYVLSSLALALAGSVVWDYWPELPIPPTVAAAVPKDPVIATLNPLSRRTDADFAALFDHPLFDPTRNRPVVEGLAPEPAPAPAALTGDAAAMQPLGSAQAVLMGTVTSPRPGGAYLGDDAGGPVVFLRPGQASLGLHLEEVHSDTAIFMGPNGEVTLILQKSGELVASAKPGSVRPTETELRMLSKP